MCGLMPFSDTANNNKYTINMLLDIIKFHAIYWPNFLKSLGHEPGLELIIHNHWIKDNVIIILYLIEKNVKIFK